jgi:hypothetical protein
MALNGARCPSRPVRAAMLCGCCATLAAGCGGSAPARLGSFDARVLTHELAGVEASAARGDRAGAMRSLAAVRARLQRLSASGTLGASEARTMLRAVAQASSAAAAELPEPAPPDTVPEAPVTAPATTAATPPPPPAAAPAHGPPPGWLKHGHHGHGPGHGHGHGDGPPEGGNGD